MSPTTRTGSIALALTLAAACGSPPPKASTSPAPEASGSAAAPPEKCDLVCGAAEVVAGPASTPDHHAAAVSNADEVFAKMHDDLLGCYAARVRQKPEAHAFITLDVLVEPDGSVRKVDTTGGAHLGDKAWKCIVDRVKRARFAPVRGGGTMQIHVPFTFRKVGPDEPI